MKSCTEQTTCFGSVRFCTPVQARTLLSEGRQLMLFIRHGATDWNLECRLQGRENIPLNETGISQAKVCAERIARVLCERVPVKGVYSSPLDRAYDTAKAIAEKLGNISCEKIPELIERDYGSLAGLTYEERKKKFKNISGDPEDMETIPDTTVRVKRAVGNIRRLDGEGAAIVVSHGGVLNCLFSAITLGRAGVGNRLTANCTVSMAAVGLRDIVPLAFNFTGEQFTEYIDEIYKKD